MSACISQNGTLPKRRIRMWKSTAVSTAPSAIEPSTSATASGGGSRSDSIARANSSRSRIAV